MKPELALLIDGDQGGAQHVEPHIKELSTKWNVSTRICIRNWRSTTDQALWDEAAREHHLECVQHAPVGRGKNASDVELVVRAMDLYHGLGYRAFCILSADTDFLPLVSRLRRAGCEAIMKPLVPRMVASKKPAPKVKLPIAPSVKPNSQAFAKVLRKALQECHDGGQHTSGWVDISRLGQQIPQDEKKENFGYGKSKTLHSVIEALSGFEVRKSGNKYQVSPSLST